MRRTLLVALIAVVVVVALARCAGCSEDCSGPNLGSPGCPCQSDQDCTTQLGTLLLCNDENICAEGDPDNVQGTVSCDSAALENTCGDGQACGADGFCAPAPECQRLNIVNVTWESATAAAPAPAPVTITVQGCQHNFDFTNPAASASAGAIDLNGDIALNNVACGDNAKWFAGFRLGRFECGGVIVAVAPSDVTPCVGTNCDATCRKPDGADVGVCP